MTPGEEQTLARLVGRVEGKIDELGRQMDRVVTSLDEKADNTDLEKLETRVAELQSNSDQGIGRDAFIKGAIGVVLTLLAIFVNGGHLP